MYKKIYPGPADDDMNRYIQVRIKTWYNMLFFVLNLHKATYDKPFKCADKEKLPIIPEWACTISGAIPH